MIHETLGLQTKTLKTRLFHSILITITGFLATLTLTGCGGSSSNDNTVTSQGSIRVLHASPDAPPVNVKLDGNVSISDLDYAQSSGNYSR